jgi:hypothetical protein
MIPLSRPLLVFLIVCLAAIGLLAFLSTLDASDWMVVNSNQHPSACNISREGMGIRVTWLGGRDSEFIDHLRISWGSGETRELRPTKPGQYFVIPIAPENTTVVVEAWAKDVQTYQPMHRVTV